MTYRTNTTNTQTASRPVCPIRPIRPTELIPPHGGYRSLKSYQGTEIIYDLTVEFCQRFVDHLSHSSYTSYRSYSRLSDQMIQAARSGKQNIAEGSQDSGTSKKLELKLVGVARGSLEELLIDYLDYLRQHQLNLWDRDDPRVRELRALAYRSNRSHRTYEGFLASGETAANCLISLLHQTNYLLDRQLQHLEQDFLLHGGFTERLYKARVQNISKK